MYLSEEWDKERGIYLPKARRNLGRNILAMHLLLFFLLQSSSCLYVKSQPEQHEKEVDISLLEHRKTICFGDVNLTFNGTVHVNPDLYPWETLEIWLWAEGGYPAVVVPDYIKMEGGDNNVPFQMIVSVPRNPANYTEIELWAKMKYRSGIVAIESSGSSEDSAEVLYTNEIESDTVERDRSYDVKGEMIEYVWMMGLVIVTTGISLFILKTRRNRK